MKRVGKNFFPLSSYRFQEIFFLKAIAWLFCKMFGVFEIIWHFKHHRKKTTLQASLKMSDFRVENIPSNFTEVHRNIPANTQPQI